LAIGLVVMLLVTRALGVGFFLDPWNPYVIVLPLFAVVLLAWDATAGDLWALPVAIGIGSFVVQSHVGTTLAVAAPIGVAAASVLVMNGVKACRLKRSFHWQSWPSVGVRPSSSSSNQGRHPVACHF
jgi:hypothetical protein